MVYVMLKIDVEEITEELNEELQKLVDNEDTPIVEWWEEVD